MHGNDVFPSPCSYGGHCTERQRIRYLLHKIQPTYFTEIDLMKVPLPLRPESAQKINEAFQDSKDVSFFGNLIVRYLRFQAFL